MIFYAFLFVGSIIVAGVVVWMYRAVVEASTKTYKSILPSSHNNLSMRAMEGVATSGHRVKGRPTPWGWKKSAKLEGRVSVAVPAHSRRASRQVGWPYRAEPFADSAAKSTAKAASSVSSKPRRAASGGVNKPWGW